MQSAECGVRISAARPQRRHWVFIAQSAFRIPQLKTLGGEIASRLAYTQKSEGQNLPSDQWLNEVLE
jgi:hypothetical protein